MIQENNSHISKLLSLSKQRSIQKVKELIKKNLENKASPKE
jgi:hypothetical protein